MNTPKVHRDYPSEKEEYDQFLRASYQISNLILNNKRNIPFQDIVDIMGLYSSASRIYIYLSNEDSANFLLKAEFCAKNITPISKNTKEGFSYLNLLPKQWLNKMVKNQFKKEDALSFYHIEEKTPEKQNIRSTLLSPIFVENKVKGIIGLDNFQSNIQWTDAKKDFIKYCVKFIEHQLEQTNTIKHLSKNESNLRALFATMTDFVFEIDNNGKYIDIAPTSPKNNLNIQNLPPAEARKKHAEAVKALVQEAILYTDEEVTIFPFPATPQF